MDTELNEVKVSYGCIFCLTGKELLVANSIEMYDNHVRARAVCLTKRYSSKGVTRLQNDIVIKGYVFFEAPENLEIKDIFSHGDIISVLKYTDGDWHLFGEDEEYARWIFKYNGVLPISKAYKIGAHICIIDGPLKELEGQIVRIDKRNKSGQVVLNFAGRQLKVWLGFEIVKELEENGETLDAIKSDQSCCGA